MSIGLLSASYNYFLKPGTIEYCNEFIKSCATDVAELYFASSVLCVLGLMIFITKFYAR